MDLFCTNDKRNRFFSHLCSAISIVLIGTENSPPSTITASKF